VWSSPLEIDGETICPHDAIDIWLPFRHTELRKTCEAKFYQQLSRSLTVSIYLCPMVNTCATEAWKSAGLEISAA